ncbi:hypothetical protein Tco_1442261 [Tanacetum coccineum]
MWSRSQTNVVSKAVVRNVTGARKVRNDKNPMGAVLGEKNVPNEVASFTLWSFSRLKWTPNASLLKEDLLLVPIWVKLYDIPIVVFTKDEDDGEVPHMVRVEYDWEPPRCGVCKPFGHDDMTSPHHVAEIPKKLLGI